MACQAFLGAFLLLLITCNAVEVDNLNQVFDWANTDVPPSLDNILSPIAPVEPIQTSQIQTPHSSLSVAGVSPTSVSSTPFQHLHESVGQFQALLNSPCFPDTMDQLHNILHADSETQDTWEHFGSEQANTNSDVILQD
ncbi:hypothetical protein PGTUg99_035400 [Puccinia graminis f. sp. tritici]|uniref:Uncharacterized protein n=1 Tax=Puccinia graminis f. sp. tritici TaxID=56615 RepID=A0A5B0MFW8_PUCGR|nr:hypothetical protein PGTUg99_035400 [Puccinia graminis f. sp. tritici]